jgi:hypothetical protein
MECPVRITPGDRGCTERSTPRLHHSSTPILRPPGFEDEHEHEDDLIAAMPLSDLCVSVVKFDCIRC